MIGIKGVAMPKSCWYCDYTHEEPSGGHTACIFTGEPLCKDETARPKECPLEETADRTQGGSKPILDACCGSRMFWFDKENQDALFMDSRTVHETLCDGRRLDIAPDITGDFRDMPFADSTFYLVVFDPPHLLRAGDNSWLAKKYGKLDPLTWREDLKKGFSECMRVLKPHGVLVFKWNEDQVKLSEILKLIDKKPLFGNRKGKTHWLVFMKNGG